MIKWSSQTHRYPSVGMHAQHILQMLQYNIIVLRLQLMLIDSVQELFATVQQEAVFANGTLTFASKVDLDRIGEIGSHLCVSLPVCNYTICFD